MGGGGGPSGAKPQAWVKPTWIKDIDRLRAGPEPHFGFAGTGTAANPMGRDPKLEQAKGFKAHFRARDESVFSEGKEVVFRTYTPKNAAAFNRLASNPNFSTLRTATGHLTFMQTDAKKSYLHTARGERADVSKAAWVNGKMVVVKRPDSFKVAGPGRRELAKIPSTVAGCVLEKSIKVVELPRGKGYQVTDMGNKGLNARKVLVDAGYSYRRDVNGVETYMNQATAQGMRTASQKPKL